MLVKDKKNLLTFNQWSATEYLHNTKGFAQFSTSESTGDYSVIGSTSIYLTPSDSQWWVDVLLSDEVGLITDTQYTFSADVYIKSGSGHLRLLNNNVVILEVSSSTPGLNHLSLSGAITEEINDPRIRFLVYNGGSMYIDNIKVITQ